MKIDLNRLKEQAQVEEQESNSRSNNGSNGDYRVVYPGENGKLTVKLLFNLKSETVQRKITRHDTGKFKVACLEQYGEDCPACKAVQEAETNRGKEAGAFRKYGWKVRGLCFAQIIDHEATYFTKDGDPKKGDIVILQYPRTVYDLINKIIIDSINQGVNLVSENEGIPIVIERTQKGNAFPSYNAYLFPYGSRKSFEDDAEKTGEQKFDELLESLPDLSETMIPKHPTEEVRKQIKALADTINQEYAIGNGVVNPGDKVPEKKEEQPSSGNLGDLGKPQESKPEEKTESDSVPVQNNGSKPECYGHHKNGEKKCMLCPLEEDCFTAEA